MSLEVYILLVLHSSSNSRPLSNSHAKLNQFLWPPDKKWDSMSSFIHWSLLASECAESDVTRIVLWFGSRYVAGNYFIISNMGSKIKHKCHEIISMTAKWFCNQFCNYFTINFAIIQRQFYINLPNIFLDIESSS